MIAFTIPRSYKLIENLLEASINSKIDDSAANFSEFTYFSKYLIRLDIFGQLRVWSCETLKLICTFCYLMRNAIKTKKKKSNRSFYHRNFFFCKQCIYCFTDHSIRKARKVCFLFCVSYSRLFSLSLSQLIELHTTKLDQSVEMTRYNNREKGEREKRTPRFETPTTITIYSRTYKMYNKIA